MGTGIFKTVKVLCVCVCVCVCVRARACAPVRFSVGLSMPLSLPLCVPFCGSIKLFLLNSVSLLDCLPGSLSVYILKYSFLLFKYSFSYYFYFHFYA